MPAVADAAIDEDLEAPEVPADFREQKLIDPADLLSDQEHGDLAGQTGERTRSVHPFVAYQGHVPSAE
jgi:hypothetical protein